MKNEKIHFYIFNNCILIPEGMSGSDRRVIHWARIFKNNGCQITLVTSRYGLPRFEKSGFNILSTGGIDFRKFGFGLAILKQIISGAIVSSSIKPEERNVIYSSSDLLADFLPALILKMRCSKSYFLCGLHLLALNPFKNRSWFSLKNVYYYLSQNLVILAQKRMSDLVLVSNSSDRDLLLSLGFKESQVMVTHGGVDFALIPKKEQKKKFDAVWVGRLHRQKGIEDLFYIWQEVIKDFQKAKLLVVGENLVRDYFFSQGFSESLKDNVSFSGFLQGKELFQAIASARMLIFPSYHESFGMVIAEAMACGLPVVAYNLPAYKQVWTNGIIKVAVGDKKKMVDVVVGLLKNEGKLRELSYEAKIAARRFNWEETAGQIIKKISRKI